MNIGEPSRPETTLPLFRLAFRAGFLLAASFAVLAMGRWLLWMSDPAAWDAAISPHWWHAHEMIFGFAMPVVAGFLLSAVATWTGIPGTTGNTLKALFALWLLARATLWLSPDTLILAWAAEMGFILLLMFELGKRVWAKRQWRNIFFLPVLFALAALSSVSFYAAQDALLSTRLHYGALWMITVLVVIVGGRVTPLFTGNGLGFKITPLPTWFENIAIGSTLVVGLAIAIWPEQQLGPWLRILCFTSFLIHLYRLAHWQGWRTSAVPLLWSMHLSYLCIPLSLLGLAIAGDNPMAIKNIMHLLAIGTVGGMILSMMSRVSLGHTGRPLQVPGGMAWAFALLLLAALIRAVTPMLSAELTPGAWKVSALLWIIAFAIFALRYFGILTSPRADGKPG
ncbi:MAG: NnrS family protein [Halioglobus sp.]